MAIRKCTRCELIKDETDFNLRDEKQGLLQYVCRDCQREQMRDRYAKNRENVLEINRQSTHKSQIRAASFIQEYLSGKSCTDCSKHDMDVPTFDHVRGDKKYDISNMISRGYSIDAR